MRRITSDTREALFDTAGTRAIERQAAEALPTHTLMARAGEAVARLAQHHRCSPDTLSAHQVQAYLLHLLNERKLSRSTVNQYGCAFRFLYIQVLERDRGVDRQHQILGGDVVFRALELHGGGGEGRWMGLWVRVINKPLLMVKSI